MAMEKTGYKDANQATTKVNVAYDSEGYIAGPDEVAAKQKRFTINKVATENGLTDNTEVLQFFLDIANGRQDSLSNQMQVTWKV